MTGGSSGGSDTGELSFSRVKHLSSIALTLGSLDCVIANCLCSVPFFLFSKREGGRMGVWEEVAFLINRLVLVHGKSVRLGKRRDVRRVK